MSSPVLPLLVSTQLPSLAELQTQLKGLQDRLAVYMNRKGMWNDLQRRVLQKQVADKQKQIDQFKNPTDQSGVPPAPDASPILGPRIEVPKVGFDDLKITLPR